MPYTSRSVYEFISKQTSDPIIEWKTCTISGTQFPIYQSDVDFYNKISPTFAGQKFQIPTPTLCPEERQRRRLSFRNERKLYRRKCDASGVDMISIYSPDKPHKIYNQKYRWSDNRDPMIYGFEFNFSKNFTENFRELVLQVPHPSMIATGCENCDYTCFTLESKECYMSSGITQSEHIMYANFIKGCDSIIDSTMTYDSSYGYQCIDCIKIYNCYFCSQLVDCNSCYMCIDCQQCSFCIGCSGIQNKEYYYQNEFIGKERFQELRDSIGNRDSINKLQQSLEKFRSSYIAHENNILSTNIFGNNIIESQNSSFCFDTKDAQDSKYLGFTPHARSSQDSTYTAPRGVEYCYDVCSTVGAHSSAFTFLYWYGTGSYYLLYCQSCDNCFGCIGLKNKQHCIFNRQYTKEEYEVQVAKIISHMMTTGEWGKFFHPSLSPFGYNETVAQEHYPIKELELTEFGYKRSDYSSDPKIPAGASTLAGNQIPSNITETSDDILKQVLICEVSGRPYMIQKAELDFYRKHNLPIPSKHPDIRHEERMKLRPGRTLYMRTCDCCGKEMLSVYSPSPNDDAGVMIGRGLGGGGNEGKIYCEQCYQKEVFG